MGKHEDFFVESYVQVHPHLRIAFITETYPPEINGVAMTVGRLVNGLLKKGHSVQLIRPRQTKNEVASMHSNFEEVLATGVPIPQYGGLKFGLPAKSKLVSLWKRDRPDLVHIVTEGPLGWSAIEAARKLKLPITSSFHTNFHSYTSHYKLKVLKNSVSSYLRKLHNKTMTTLVPTQALAKTLEQEGYRNLMVLSRGVDTQLFNPTRRSDALRASWGVDENTLAVIYVGRLALEKNIDLLLAAFEAIQLNVPTAKLVFVGDGPLRSDLEKKCTNAIFAGMRSGTDLAAHYASADLFIFPSETETFGNVTTEALASGLAVLAYDYAAAADLIESNENGVTVKLGDKKAFILAAARLAENKTLLAHLKSNANNSVQSLDWENIHDRFISILSNIVANENLKRKVEVSEVKFI